MEEEEEVVVAVVGGNRATKKEGEAQRITMDPRSRFAGSSAPRAGLERARRAQAGSMHACLLFRLEWICTRPKYTRADGSAVVPCLPV